MRLRRASRLRNGRRRSSRSSSLPTSTMVGVLVDLIIPRDERSGSATEAGVPQFMDFMMVDQPQRQVAMRGGLALIDRRRRIASASPSSPSAIPSGAACSTIAYTTTRSGIEPRDRVLQQLPRSHRQRLLVDEGGDSGSVIKGTRSWLSGRDVLTPRSRSWASAIIGDWLVSWE